MSLLISRYTVIGLRRKGGDFVFAPVSACEQVTLDYDTTILPPKKFFLINGETLFKFDLNGQAISDVPSQAEKWVLFGLHPCDIRGLQLLNLVFSGEYRDSQYFARRERAIIIGYGCEPGENCFCHSMDADEVESGFDLFFTDLDEGYLVRIGSAEGDNILRKTARAREVTEVDLGLLRMKSKLRKGLFALNVDRTDLPDFLDLAHRSNNGFRFQPGQFMMISVFGVGEAPFSISSSPSRPGYLEFCIRDCGNVTGSLHRMKAGDTVGLRGPFGNGFPVEEMKGKDVLVIAGGLGVSSASVFNCKHP